MALGSSQKRHIVIRGFSEKELFQSRKIGRGQNVPLQNRAAHGNYLMRKYLNVVARFEQSQPKGDPPISPEVGIYVEIHGLPGYELPLESLDTSKDFKLRSCKRVDDKEIALIFIPESRRHIFQQKLSQYLNPDKDGKVGPRNHTLIDSITEIKLADLSSFWTDAPNLFPSNKDAVIWWELWLKKESASTDISTLANQLAKRIGAKIGNTSLSFFDSTAILIKASANQLEHAPELITNLEEVRKAKETPFAFMQFNPTEQVEWVDNLSDRVTVESDSNTAVTILDDGVNYQNPLLAHVCNASRSTVWNPAWSHYNSGAAASFSCWDHGSRQAGIASFGDLQKPLLSTDTITLTHWIESGRILPPRGQNDPDLYGAITTGTVSKLEITNPNVNRVFSLAVTADPEAEGGQPSSWSAGIDQFSSGYQDEKQRLFVISAGNNRNVSSATDYWDQLHLAQIEDPAQSWNALTVGAYTEKTHSDDPTFTGWTALAQSGDIAPTSRSSVSWSWGKQAPYKPDLVAEGGNLLLSPNQIDLSDGDPVSLLTTSGRSTGQLFDTTRDTSAACALVARDAAILMAEYPNYWPETIRGLLVHSAQWTPRMFERFGQLCQRHNQQTAKKIMLRSAGYGVADIARARYSANNKLTLIVENQLQPFNKDVQATSSSDPKLFEMQLYKLPWPIETLQDLPHNLEVKLKVTLSYFIEPNPGRRGYRQRFSYQSHGLRFEVIRPGQPLANFRSFINGLAESEDYDGPQGTSDGWFLGPQLRTRGSLHADYWVGPASELADMHTIAVYPVGGWWKYRTAQERWQNRVRYSLLVSIEVPDESVDIYSTIENLIQIQIET